MNLRSRLNYANVVATIALILVVGGGTVYAAAQLGKDSVKSKNIAKGAVKNSDLAKKAVTSPKVKNGSIEAKDLAAGVVPALDADVTGSATAGPKGGINTNAITDLPLSGMTSFTVNAGEVGAIAAEGQFTVASTSAAQSCDPFVGLLVNGKETRVFVSPEDATNSTTPIQSNGYDADGPFGLLSPGTPLTITAVIGGDPDCTAGSQLDKLEIKIIQID